MRAFSLAASALLNMVAIREKGKLFDRPSVHNVASLKTNSMRVVLLLYIVSDNALFLAAPVTVFLGVALVV